MLGTFSLNPPRLNGKKYDYVQHNEGFVVRQSLFRATMAASPFYSVTWFLEVFFRHAAIKSTAPAG